MEQLALDSFKNNVSTDTGIPEKNTPPLDEVYQGETVYTCHTLHFYSYTSTSTEVSTIYDITINSTSLLAYTMVTSTIRSQHTDEK